MTKYIRQTPHTIAHSKDRGENTSKPSSESGMHKKVCVWASGLCCRFGNGVI